LAFSNRSRFDIIASILEKAVPGAKKTWLLYAANLSFGQHQKYLRTLIGLGLVERQGDMYSTTEKGQEFLESYQRLMGILGESEAAIAENGAQDRLRALSPP
jgi:predicted transcriptional regulator